MGSYLGPAENASFCFWCYSRKQVDEASSRFPCVTAGVERFSLDLKKI